MLPSPLLRDAGIGILRLDNNQLKVIPAGEQKFTRGLITQTANQGKLVYVTLGHKNNQIKL